MWLKKPYILTCNGTAVKFNFNFNGYHEENQAESFSKIFTHDTLSICYHLTKQMIAYEAVCAEKSFEICSF